LFFETRRSDLISVDCFSAQGTFEAMPLPPFGLRQQRAQAVRFIDELAIQAGPPFRVGEWAVADDVADAGTGFVAF
jgi:hypothetical protein